MSYRTVENWRNLLFEKELALRKLTDNMIVKELIEELNKMTAREEMIIRMLFGLETEQVSYKEIGFMLDIRENHSKILIKQAVNKLVAREWRKYLPKNIINYNTPKKINIINDLLKHLLK